MSGKASTYYPNGIKPRLGDTIGGIELGRCSRGIYIWSACPNCGLERWLNRCQSQKLCMSCAAVRRQTVGEKNHRWNGGIRHAYGYDYVSVDENHPFISMASKVFVHGKYRYSIAEHRLVMAQHLRRPLEVWELVHHKNGIKDDNRIENLELLTHKQHLPSMNLQRTVKDLQSRVTILEAENTLLLSLLIKYGNPELADSEMNRASVETLYGTSQVDEEKVHTRRKL